jgi:hypothetical protein
MIAMDRKDRNGNVDVGIFVVDMRECTFKDRCSIGEEFERTWFHAQAVLSECTHDLVQGLSGGFVVVKEIASEENHIDLFMLEIMIDIKGDGSYIFSSGEVQNLIESSPTIIPTNRVSLFITDMIVGRNEDTNGIRLYGR